jgi:predicted GNAT family N-acyltransferase
MFQPFLGNQLIFSPMSFRVVISDYQTQNDAIRAVRTEVFLVEQEIPPELEYDNDDLTCLHAVAWNGDLAVGTARLDVKQEGRIGRVAVLKNYRRQGIGSMLMHSLEESAKSNGLRRIWFHSQVSAVPFYLSLGYRPYGEEYLEANIPHLSMEKEL